MSDLRDALGQALRQAGRISEQELREAEESRRDEEERQSREQLEALERERVEQLFNQLQRVTSVRRFRGIARNLLLLRPDYVDIVAKSARSLPRHKDLPALLEQVAHLEEWLLSLSAEEQETLIEQTL